MIRRASPKRKNMPDVDAIRIESMAAISAEDEAKADDALVFMYHKELRDREAASA